MRHGIVIGTYDSAGQDGRRHGVASVELNLAVIRARCGAVPVLVADDASPPCSQWGYRAICLKYGAQFVTSPQRLGHTSGDIAAFGRGLAWARSRGLLTLTKLSQRMIIDVPGWLADDAEQLLATTYGTMTAPLSNFGVFSRVRTEAVMMNVARWTRPEVLSRYQPRQYNFWNEGHTFETVRGFVDPDKPFPHYLAWDRVQPVRGRDRPPVYFRQMKNADTEFQALADRYGVGWPDGLRMIDSILTVDYVG